MSSKIKNALNAFKPHQEACWEALQQGHVHYAPAAGIPGLREALAKRAEEATLMCKFCVFLLIL